MCKSLSRFHLHKGFERNTFPAPPGWDLNPSQVTLTIHVLLTDSECPFMPLGGERVLRVRLPNEITMRMKISLLEVQRAN